MILIVVISIILGLLRWSDETEPKTPSRRAWNGPITIRTTRDEDLESLLKRFGLAIRGPRLKHGPLIAVDTGGLKEAARTLASPIGMDRDVVDMTAREFLESALKPLGLACKLQDGQVMITSGRSSDETLDYGDHGETFCNHNDGPWLLIYGGKRAATPN